MSDESKGLSLNIANDALGLSMMMDDQMQRIALYEGIIRDIRQVLGDDGFYAQLHELPEVVRRRCVAAEVSGSPKDPRDG